MPAMKRDRLSRTPGESRGGKPQAPLDARTTEDAARPTERRQPAPLAIKRLLVPMDGTSYAERALPYAAAIAAAAGASVTLAHVRTPHAVRPQPRRESVTEPLIGDLRDHDVADYATYLHWLREWMQPYVPDVSIEIQDAGTVLQGLLAIEAQRQTSVVVLASHARRGMQRYFLGSVADGLVREGPSPVLVIPPLVETPRQRLPLMTRLLLPLDGSMLAEQALGPVTGWLGGRTPSEITPREVFLLSVESSQQGVLDAGRYLEGVRSLLAPRVPSVQVTTYALQGVAPDAIVAAANQGVPSSAGERAPADLIVMATHGRGGLGRWIYGSVAEFVVARVSVPILLTHPAAGV
jgi:nucleotide-binding universal stress UspA family protein